MKFTVILSQPALVDIDLAYTWLAQRTLNAGPWHDRLLDAINSLEDNPLRCPLAPEDDQTSEETRQLLYGNKRHAYRVLFTIRNDKVWITHVRHAARR